MGQPAGRRDVPLPPPAQGQPRGLVSVGRGSACSRPRGGPADPPLDRLLRLPLVPRDGARVVRGRGDRALDKRALRPDQADREECPDLDSIYMQACQAMTGHGGWPPNVFLTPEHVPFYAGTYSRRSLAAGCRAGGWCSPRPAQAWDERKDEIRSGLTDQSAPFKAGLLQPSTEPMDARLLDEAVGLFRAQYDPVHGGFGGAPKFPPASAIEFILRRGDTQMSAHTSVRWRRAGCTTRWAAASPATRWTGSGSSPTSRRCSTTTRSWPAPTCTAGSSRGDRLFRRVCEGRSTGRCARCAPTRAASTRLSTPTRRARRRLPDPGGAA